MHRVENVVNGDFRFTHFSVKMDIILVKFQALNTENTGFNQ